MKRIPAGTRLETKFYDLTPDGDVIVRRPVRSHERAARIAEHKKLLGLLAEMDRRLNIYPTELARVRREYKAEQAQLRARPDSRPGALAGLGKPLTAALIAKRLRKPLSQVRAALREEKRIQDHHVRHHRWAAKQTDPHHRPGRTR